MLTDLTIRQLRDDLIAAAFTFDAVATRLGATALAALGRNQTMAAQDVLGTADDPQATLIRLLVLGCLEDTRTVAAALSALPDLRAAGLVREVPGTASKLAATVEIKPYGWDDSSGWIVCDQTPLDNRVTLPRTDFVLGASPASTTLAQITARKPVTSALDLGTGCGIQALHLSGQAERIVATDLNPRALELAQITLGLSLDQSQNLGQSRGKNPNQNQAKIDLRLGSLYGPVTDERFDLIVTNPPYVMAPPLDSRLIYRESSFHADGLMCSVVTNAPNHLNDGGLLQVVGNWAITADQPWQDRLNSWIEPTGCDALVLCRETLDIYEYIELWLTDAGLSGTPGYADAYRRWLNYFDQCGIVGVGMGWFSLCKAGRSNPELRIENWPHAVAQPVGNTLDAFFNAVGSARVDDATLLAACCQIADDVVQETFGSPGAGDPEHIVLRQTAGLCRAVEVSTALAAVIGASDGDIPLGALIDATANLLDVDPVALRAELLSQLREMLLAGFISC